MEAVSSDRLAMPPAKSARAIGVNCKLKKLRFDPISSGKRLQNVRSTQNADGTCQQVSSMKNTHFFEITKASLDDFPILQRGQL
jgi:hypothetical protein